MAMHKVTFLPLNKTVEVDDAKYPLADHGKPGSLARHRARPRHPPGAQLRRLVRVHDLSRDRARRARTNLVEMEADEEDRLDMAEGLTIHSRLGCQAVVRGDVVVEIPK